MQVASPRLGRRAAPSVSALIGIIVALAIVAVAGYFIYQRLNPPSAPVAQQTAQVARGSIAASVNATGTVAATTISRLGFRASGRIN
jgi:multidrug efflux pump subunit AcrA (membrane-fusion protein)